MAAVPAVNVPQVAEDLKLKKAIHEYLFSAPDSDYFRVTHVELTPTEYAGLFDEGQDWHISLRDDAYFCLEQHGLSSHFPRASNSNYLTQARRRFGLDENENNGAPEAASNENYEANTEGNGAPSARRRPVLNEPERQYITQRGFLKLPRFKKHGLYQRYPWLTSFRRNGYVPMYYFQFVHDFYRQPAQYSSFSPNLFVNTNYNNLEYEEEHYYAVLVPYGMGFASLLILSPNSPQNGDKTQVVIDAVRQCAARNAPAPPMLGNIPRRARTLRRLGVLKALPNLPLNVVRSRILPYLGNEHFGPVPQRGVANTRRGRKAKNSRKARR